MADVISVSLVTGILLLIGLATLLVLGPRIIVIREGTREDIYRRGRFDRIAGPGWVLLWRFETVERRIDARNSPRNFRVEGLFVYGIPIDFTLSLWCRVDLLAAAGSDHQLLRQFAMFTDAERDQQVVLMTRDALIRSIGDYERERSIAADTIVGRLLPILPGSPENEILLAGVQEELLRQLPRIGVFLDPSRPIVVQAINVPEELLKGLSRGRLLELLRENIPAVSDDILAGLLAAIEGSEGIKAQDWQSDRDSPSNAEQETRIPDVADQAVRLFRIWQEIGSQVSGEYDRDYSRATSELAQMAASYLQLPPPELILDDDQSPLHVYRFDTSSVFPSLPLLSTIPWVMFSSPVDPQTFAQALRAALAGRVKKLGSVALVPLFVQDEQVDSVRKELSRSVAYPLAFDIIPLDRRTFIEQVVLSVDPRRALRRFILSEVRLESVSPYTVTGPAADTTFFGREYELREIAEHGTNKSYCIIGGRRIGKSSLLLRSFRLDLPQAGFRAIYHDCSNIRGYDDFAGAQIRLPQAQETHGLPMNLGELIENPFSDKPLVLLLDEADKLVPADKRDGWRLFNRLKALAHVGCAQFVLSGERTLREATHDPTSPLFNFANEMQLGPLDYRAVEELVVRPMSQLEIELVEDQAIARIVFSQYRKTRYCHPEQVGPMKCVAAKIQRRVAFLRRDSSLASRRNENQGADSLRMTIGRSAR